MEEKRNDFVEITKQKEKNEKKIENRLRAWISNIFVRAHRAQHAVSAM